MKLYRTLSLLVIALGAAGLCAAQGCGSTDSAPSSSGGRVAPGVPSGAAPSDTPARTFALNQLFLGESNRDGVVAADAWKDYGYNIDGLATTKDSKDVCQRQGGADAPKQEDGKEGIDNAFGRTVIGFLTGVVQTPSRTVNTSIQTGTFTILLDVKGLTDDAKQSNVGLSGRLLIGGNYGDGKTPTFAPNDDWPYRASPIVDINGSYINNGTFVNGAGGATVELALLIQGVTLPLTINRALVTFQHQPPNDITNGVISGVIETEALVAGITKVAGRLSPQLCTGNLLETITQTIRQASDIRADGTNAPGIPCNAISIGLGFTGKRIGAPKTIAVEGAIPPDPCLPGADGGAEGGTRDGG